MTIRIFIGMLSRKQVQGRKKRGWAIDRVKQNG